ncbi:MAG TPA: alpha/beta hydrolase-fold protein [Gammaproteobacteria bacterium]
MSEGLETVEIQTGPNPAATIVWLHGLGADGNDFVPVVDELDLAGTAVRFVFPHAPAMPVTINGGMVMRAWYDVLSADLERRADERGVRASQRLVEALLERESSRGIPAGRIVLAGFSQGGAIALQTGLRHPEPLAGVLALSCYVPLAASLEAERTDANRGVPIFLAHGVDDEIVPVGAGRRSRELLARLGYNVEWHEYAMPHSVCMEEIGDLGAWLRRVLS